MRVTDSNKGGEKRRAKSTGVKQANDGYNVEGGDMHGMTTGLTGLVLVDGKVTRLVHFVY